MRKRNVFVFLTINFFLICTDSHAQGTWTQLDSCLATRRYASAFFTIGNKGYMGTGYDGAVRKDFWEYDPVTDAWTQKANFGGTARFHAGCFSIGNKGYVGAGAFNSNVYNDFWEYNPVTDTWTQRATIPGPNRNAAAAFTLGSYGYVGLGSSTYPVTTFLNDFWRYDPAADSWMQIINFPGAPRYSVFTFSFGCEAYLGSGESGPTTPRTFHNDVWKFYFPITAGFTAVPSVCEGTPVSFTNTSTGATNYYWDFGDNTSDTVLNPTHLYSAPGSYQVLCIASHNCSSDSSVQTIIVHPNPVPVIIPNGPVNFCMGDSVVLTANGGVSYLWSTSEISPSIIVNTSGTYTVTVTDANGCSGSTSATVTVNPLPVAVITPSGSLCQGGYVNLAAGNGTSYLWSTGATTQSISVNTAGTYWVVVNNGLCYDSDTIQVQSGFFSIDLGNDTVICDGNVITLDAGAGTSWLWSTGQTTQTINVNSSGTYWVQVTSGVCMALDSVQVTVTPVSVNIGNDTAICNGDVIVLNAGTAASYLWSTGETTASINVSTPGIYSVTITNGTCSAADSIIVSQLTTSVNLGNDIVTCESSSVFLDAGTTGTLYYWSTGEISRTIEVTKTGKYWVNVTAGNCITSDTIEVTLGFGGATVYFPNAFTPNGDRKNNVFKAQGTDITYFHLQIYNRWGELCFESQDINEGWDGTYRGNKVAENSFVWICDYMTTCTKPATLRKTGHVSIIK